MPLPPQRTDSNMAKRDLVILATCAFFCCIAFLRIHMRVKTTLISYEVGRLRGQEIDLMQKKNLLTAKLAQMTTKTELLSKTKN